MTEPLNSFEFRIFTIFGNVGGIKELLKLGLYKQRRKMIETCIRQLDPERSVRWQERWKTIGPRYGSHPREQQAMTALKLKLCAGDIWNDSARAVLIEKGLLDSGSEKEIGTPWQTMDFLCEIAGYDVLHTLPNMMT